MSKYDGEELVVCPLHKSAFKHTCAVVVSGDGPNFCGHALLHVGDSWYFHIAGGYKIPKFMHESGYMRYLKENNKHEIRRWFIKLPDPEGAHAKLHEMINKRWLWGILPNNCATFVEEVLQAGGSHAGVYLNCPTMEPFT